MKRWKSSTKINSSNRSTSGGYRRVLTRLWCPTCWVSLHRRRPVLHDLEPLSRDKKNRVLISTLQYKNGSIPGCEFEKSLRVNQERSASLGEEVLVLSGRGEGRGLVVTVEEGYNKTGDWYQSRSFTQSFVGHERTSSVFVSRKSTPRKTVTFRSRERVW